MVLRKPNLLDAFQASAPEGKKGPPGKPPASVAGPFAHDPAPPKLTARPRSLGSQMATDRLVLFAVVFCLVGVGVAYWLGRTSTRPDETQAAGENEKAGLILRENPAGAAQSPDPAEANRKAAALSASEHDKAFFDPKYRFTVRVSVHPNDEAGKKSALADRDYLRGEGLPVVQPVVLDRSLVVCVGYAATIAELQQIQSYVSKLSGPKGGRKNPYQSAYVDNINHVVARK